MNIYIYVDERDIIKDIIAVEYGIVSPQYIPYHIVDLTLIGQKWDRVTETVIVNPYPEPIIITKLEYRNLFTFNEKIALYEAAKTNTIIQVFLDDVMAAQFVDLTDVSTVQGVQYLYSQNIITAGRINQILSNQKVD